MNRDGETPTEDPIDGTEEGEEIGAGFLKFIWAMQDNETTMRRVAKRDREGEG